MKYLALLLLLTAPANAAIVGNLGTNPNSAEGRFAVDIPTAGAFTDQITFQLSGAPEFLTIASVTNVFPNITDFITAFTGEVIAGTPAAPGAVVIGPVLATDNCGPDCQGFGGSALLAEGSYFLQLTGNAGGTSGFGGDLSVAAVPEASTWLMLLLGFAGIALRKTIRKKVREAFAPSLQVSGPK